ncbi:MAG: ABC transporter permease [Lachnospiraceae bacterium]|nr:ABC transporter permease [Lachnospiraceae bacterium]
MSKQKKENNNTNDKMTLLRRAWQSRSLIWKLSKNDFKKRYAGSYLGAIWAMVQPVVTVLMYYIVFDKIFNNRGEAIAGNMAIPYVLFLTAGLVPWFYFSEALNHGTQALNEYSYLVKKVVFDIEILPIIKVIAATFIHVFFMFVLVIVGAIYGFLPGLYMLQLIYYSFCMFMLVLALIYTTSAIVVFFRDLAQIIQIGLQIGMWATPILWNVTRIPPKWQIIIKLNPVAYIVGGYRDAMCNTGYFWEHWQYTLYFWAFVIVFFAIGKTVFRRLKPHFADVL